MPSLAHLIADHIATQPDRRITFAEYMEWALYHPELGYYTTRALEMGVQGDFVTSAHVTADFGELLAVQFVQMWQILGQPQPFTLLEMGAGQGGLARDILRYLQQHHGDCFASLDYAIAEKSPGLRTLQQQVLQDFPVRWCNWDEVTPDSITGCCFSNELVDAFPVHRVTLQDGQLAEIYVTTATLASSPSSATTPQFTDQIAPLSTPQLAEYFPTIGLQFPAPAYEDGYTTEVNLAALDWMAAIAQRLHRGYVLTIDYGYLAPRYYHPARDQGTLQCYYQHRHHNDPYRWVGQQDITAHVDFTALQRYGEQAGLTTVGFTQQALFLMALGLGDRIAALSNSNAILTGQDLSQFLRRREALHSLINPMGLGNFGVLIQSKGVSESSLQGLTDG